MIEVTEFMRFYDSICVYTNDEKGKQSIKYIDVYGEFNEWVKGEGYLESLVVYSQELQDTKEYNISYDDFLKDGLTNGILEKYLSQTKSIRHEV